MSTHVNVKVHIVLCISCVKGMFVFTTQKTIIILSSRFEVPEAEALFN